MCSPDLTVAAQRIAEHKRLIGPMRVSVTTSAEGTTVRYHWPPELEPPERAGAHRARVLGGAGRGVATRNEVRPLRVGAPAPPADTEAYRAFLGVPIDRTPGPVDHLLRRRRGPAVPHRQRADVAVLRARAAAGGSPSWPTGPRRPSSCARRCWRCCRPVPRPWAPWPASSP